MSAAELARWLRDTAETVPGAGFVTLCPESPAEKVTPKNDPPRGRNAVCDLVTAVTAFSVGVEKQDAESRPQRTDPYAIGASWRPLAARYYGHHFGCKACCGAGRGHGTRCPAGAELWASYEAASDAAHDTQGRRAR